MKLTTLLKQYKMVAKQSNPSIKEIMSREQAVGNMENYLGGVMIPYYIKAFRLLNASQRIKYKKLMIMNWKKMETKAMMTIHGMIEACMRK